MGSADPAGVAPNSQLRGSTISGPRGTRRAARPSGGSRFSAVWRGFRRLVEDVATLEECVVAGDRPHEAAKRLCSTPLTINFAQRLTPVSIPVAFPNQLVGSRIGSRAGRYTASSVLASARAAASVHFGLSLPLSRGHEEWPRTLLEGRLPWTPTLRQTAAQRWSSTLVWCAPTPNSRRRTKERSTTQLGRGGIG